MELSLVVKEVNGLYDCRVVVTGRGPEMSFVIRGKATEEEAFDSAIVKLRIIYTSKVIGR
jgi:hypothetical protein